MCKKGVGNLADEIMDALSGRTLFKNFSWREFVHDASLFVESGFGHWEKISLMDEEARKFLRGVCARKVFPQDNFAYAPMFFAQRKRDAAFLSFGS